MPPLPFWTHCRHARRSGTDDLITITITVGGIITIIIIITARTAITITTIAGIIITTTIITIATMTIDDVAFTESCCRRARCR
jgi:hypothetical protein